MTVSRQIIVFIGPSLPAEGLPAGLEAELRPPAAQGDIVAAALQSPGCVIALVDGVFHGVPAVRHKEILCAISQGATVFGAASMGALRAAELHRHGMYGRGLIYRWYRRFPLAPDDAVAVLHAPVELGASAITASLIDLRIGFRRARQAGRISAEMEGRLSLAAAELHYTERTLPAVLRRVAGAGANVESAGLLEAGPTQKQGDAGLLLRELWERQSVNVWPKSFAASHFVATDAFLQDMAEAGFSMDSFAGG